MRRCSFRRWNGPLKIYSTTPRCRMSFGSSHECCLAAGHKCLAVSLATNCTAQFSTGIANACRRRQLHEVSCTEPLASTPGRPKNLDTKSKEILARRRASPSHGASSGVKLGPTRDPSARQDCGSHLLAAPRHPISCILTLRRFQVLASDSWKLTFDSA